MLITYTKLARKDRVFKSLTGLSVTEFDELLTALLPRWEAAERQRLKRPQRQRALGGGRKYALGVAEQLLMVLCWLRLYLNTEALGFFFGVDKATVSRNTRRILKVLRAMGETTLGWPEPPTRKQGKNVAEALRAYPDLLAIVDATEQRVQRSGVDDLQKKHYSGKKKTHTRKTAIVVNEHGLIRGVTTSQPGAKHDIKHVSDDGVLAQVPKTVTIIGDAGFDGLSNYYPDHSVGTPHKARRNQPLTEDQKLANRLFSGERIIVENTFAELKHFKVLKDQFRHAVDLYDDVFRAVVGLVNTRIARRLQMTLT